MARAKSQPATATTIPITTPAPWYLIPGWWNGLTDEAMWAKAHDVAISHPGIGILIPSSFIAANEMDDGPVETEIPPLVPDDPWSLDLEQQKESARVRFAALADGKSVDEPDSVDDIRHWYQSPDWWSGLSIAQIRRRIVAQTPDDAIVLIPRRAIVGAIVDRAWEIYRMLTERIGYSTQHGRQAWDGATDFEQGGGDNGDGQ